MPRSYTNLIYHIVFARKGRRPLISPDKEARLYEYISGIIRGLGCVLEPGELAVTQLRTMRWATVD